MKAEQVLLYAGGAFLLYKLFIAPKSTVIPTQAAPIYTGQPVTASQSNTGSLLALGTGIASQIANLLKGSAPASSAPAASQTSAGPGAQTSSNIDDEISDIFGSGFSNPVAVTTQPASGGLINLGSGVSDPSANNFGLPTSFSAASLDDDD